VTTNKTGALGLTPNAPRDSRKTLAGSYRKSAPQSTPRRLLDELHAAALAVSPGRAAFVTTASTRAWFRIERLDVSTARVSHVSEAFVVESLLEDAAFLDAEPLGEVA